MATLAQVRTEITTLTTKVAAIGDIVQSTITLLQGLNAMIASLRQQLADAIAGGSDPAALQGIVDNLVNIETTLEAKKAALAAAVVANTPSA